MKVLPDGRIVVVLCWSDEDSFIKGAYTTRESAHEALWDDGYNQTDDPVRDLWWHPDYDYNAEVQEFKAQS